MFDQHVANATTHTQHDGCVQLMQCTVTQVTNRYAQVASMFVHVSLHNSGIVFTAATSACCAEASASSFCINSSPATTVGTHWATRG